MIRLRTFLPAAAALLWAASVAAQAPLTPPHVRVDAKVDSGYLHNPTGQAAVVFQHRFDFDETAWLQLHFGEVVSLPAGSFLRMTARADGARQRHDGRSLVEWAGQSALFNGAAVTLELVAGPHTRGNRVTVDEATLGLDVAMPESICGPTDDRSQSSDPRQGRLFRGCTGWMIDTDVMLTAGHCIGGTEIIEFNVPLSTPSGSIVRSHPDDQYPFTTLNSLSGGVGADWGVCRVGTNSNTGQLPTQANGGQWYDLGSVPSGASGQNIRITGYGSTSPRNQLYLAQKTHVGPLAQIRSTSLCYITDTTGGNSGSPVIHENTGDAIGIHTHGGCSSSGGCNSGTRIDRSDLQAAIRSATGVRPGSLATFGQGCPGTGQSPTYCATLNGSGGNLAGTTASNEYAYQASSSRALQVTGFRIYSQSTTGSSETVSAALYLDSGGQPASSPLATTTVTIGANAGFHLADFGRSLSVPAGTFYVAVDHAAGTTVLSELSNGSQGVGFWRRPPQQVSWSLSGFISRPAYQVVCAGGGSNNAVPAITGTGTPELGRSYQVGLAFAAPGQPATQYVGLSDQTWAGGSLPFSLGVLGAPQCSLLQSADVALSFTTSAQGDAQRSFPVPMSNALVGSKLYHQWFVIDPAANAGGVVSSAGLEVTLGG